MSAPQRERSAKAGRFATSLRWLSAAASGALFILVALGGFVRVSGSGLGCPGWPLCHGGLLPPAEVTAIIEFSHRLMAVIASGLVAAVGTIAVKYHWDDRSILIPALAACGVLVIQIALGAVTVFMELPPTIVAIHLGTGLILLGCALTVATHAAAGARQPGPAELPPGLGSLAVAVMVSIFSVVVMGAVVTASSASLACPGWPVCGDQSAVTPGASLQMAHRLAVLASGCLIVWLAAEVWRIRAAAPTAWTMTVNLAGVFAAQALIGGLNVLTRLAVVPREAHIAFGSLVWGLSVVVATLVLRQQGRIPATNQPPGIGSGALPGFHHGQPG